MTIRRRRRFIPVAAALAVLGTGGCLISEEDDLQIVLDEHGTGGTMTIVQANMQSNDTTDAGRSADFSTLIRQWKDDAHLLEGVRGGYYIKERRLWLEGGRLFWKQVAIFPDLPEALGAVRNDTLWMPLAGDGEVVSTDGTVASTDSGRVVCWPLERRDFRLKVRNRGFKPTTSFADSFRAWRRAHPKD